MREIYDKCKVLRAILLDTVDEQMRVLKTNTDKFREEYYTLIEITTFDFPITKNGKKYYIMINRMRGRKRILFRDITEEWALKLINLNSDEYTETIRSFFYGSKNIIIC
jgi:hypothetical protein